MKQLFQAIYNYFKSEEIAVTDIYNTDAPSKAVFPYVVMRLISDSSEWTFTENDENCLIQFNIYSSSSDSGEACDLFQAIKDSFDFVDIPIENYESVSLTREPGAALNRWEVEGKKVWDFMMQYRFVIQKTT